MFFKVDTSVTGAVFWAFMVTIDFLCSRSCALFRLVKRLEESFKGTLLDCSRVSGDLFSCELIPQSTMLVNIV